MFVLENIDGEGGAPHTEKFRLSKISRLFDNSAAHDQKDALGSSSPTFQLVEVKGSKGTKFTIERKLATCSHNFGIYNEKEGKGTGPVVCPVKFIYENDAANRECKGEMCDADTTEGDDFFTCCRKKDAGTCGNYRGGDNEISGEAKCVPSVPGSWTFIKANKDVKCHGMPCDTSTPDSPDTIKCCTKVQPTCGDKAGKLTNEPVKCPGNLVFDTREAKTACRTVPPHACDTTYYSSRDTNTCCHSKAKGTCSNWNGEDNSGASPVHCPWGWDYDPAKANIECQDTVCNTKKENSIDTFKCCRPVEQKEQ
jgi:hypothetical protein